MVMRAPSRPAPDRVAHLVDTESCGGFHEAPPAHSYEARGQQSALAIAPCHGVGATDAAAGGAVAALTRCRRGQRLFRARPAIGPGQPIGSVPRVFGGEARSGDIETER